MSLESPLDNLTYISFKPYQSPYENMQSASSIIEN